MQQLPTLGYGPGGSIAQIVLLGFTPSAAGGGDQRKGPTRFHASALPAAGRPDPTKSQASAR
jgi:hypothetical protein